MKSRNKKPILIAAVNVLLSLMISTSSCEKVIPENITKGATSANTYSARKVLQVSLDIKYFGAKGDGKTDDYPAFKALADSVNKRKGNCSIKIPSGNYYIAQYRKKTNNNYIQDDITFKNCDGITIIGESGTVINVKGSLNRTKDYFSIAWWYSYTSSLNGLTFQDCKNITVKNLELNGNVNRMTRASEVLSNGDGGFGLMFNTCHNVTVENIYSHHWQSDGVYFGGISQSKNVTMKNVTSANNARQAMTITGLQGGYFENCKFNETGLTGNYKSVPPASGVDIEPDVDTRNHTFNIEFNGCEFKNNLGGQLLMSTPTRLYGITVRNCHFIADNPMIYSPYQITTAARGVIIDNCSMYFKKGALYATWDQFPGSDVKITNCDISSNSVGIIAASRGLSYNVLIQKNKLKFIGTKMTSYFPYLQTRNLSFLNNEIFIPSIAVRSRKYHSLIQNALISKGNKFYSDNPRVKPKIGYDGTKVVADQ